MRKIITVLCFALLTSCALWQREERFVNPIFYETMEEIGYEYSTIKLTPTTYYIKNFYGYHTSAECEMLENLEDRITLKCLFMPADPNNEEELIIVGSDDTPKIWTQTYIIWPEQNHKSGTTIVEYSYYESEEDWCSRQPYITVSPEKKL